MTAEDRNPALNAASGAPGPELQVSSVLHLISRDNAGSKAREDGNRLTPAIECHLQALADQPGNHS